MHLLFLLYVRTDHDGGKQKDAKILWDREVMERNHIYLFTSLNLFK